MSKLIKQLMTEYDEMRADGYWDEDHPIVQMAEHIDSLVQQRAELVAKVERLRLAILNAIPFIPGGSVKADLRDAYDETPPAALAALKAQWQAEAVENAIKELQYCGCDGQAWVSELTQCAIRLRSQE